jgi:hypothetical protein
MDPMSSAASIKPKMAIRLLNVHISHSDVNAVESVSQRQRFAMERFNAPTEKTRRIATSGSHGDAQPTRSLADQASACLNTNSAMQSSLAETDPMSLHTFVDHKS